MEHARELSRRFIIADTHIDVPYRLEEKLKTGEYIDVGMATEDGDFDYPRAREGGLDLPFMSIYIPAEFEETGEAGPVADKLIDMVERLAADHPDKFTIVSSVAQAKQSFADGLIGLALGMENGAPVQGDLRNLKHFYDRGIRYITLTHSKNNHICDSSYAKTPRWDGLSPFGEKVVAEMNRLGIMIDISHVSDKAFYSVMELTQAPVLASHSSCRHFTPDFERNMDDDMIRLLADKGGVIQINFGSSFILGDAQKQSSAYWDARSAYIAENELDDDSPEAQDYRTRYWEENERIFADVTDVVDHIDHVVQIAGIDHVGLGSDFDGVGDSLPTGLKDVSYFPNLIGELLRRGYSDEDIEKICSGNLMRVWSEVERFAEQVQPS